MPKYFSKNPFSFSMTLCFFLARPPPPNRLTGGRILSYTLLMVVFPTVPSRVSSSDTSIPIKHRAKDMIFEAPALDCATQFIRNRSNGVMQFVPFLLFFGIHSHCSYSYAFSSWGMPEKRSFAHRYIILQIRHNYNNF